MNLDHSESYARLDTENMYAHIDGLPDQLEQAWALGQKQPFEKFKGIRQIVIAGMGGSAIGADLLAAYVQPVSPHPVTIHRDYDLPAWVQGPETLVIASSHSGNTEETLSAYQEALRKGCQTMVISTGGRLNALAREKGLQVWNFEHHGQPRAAVGFSFGLLLAFFARQGWIPDPSDELAGAIAAMRTQQQQLRKEVPVIQNPAKRQAGQLVGRWVVVIGSGLLAPVARRWKGQISEVAKAWAQFEFLPEVDHNTLAGVECPPELIQRTVVLFLTASSNHSRNLQRSELTQREMMLAGLGTDLYAAQGDTPLAQMWTALHFGDYMAYYLAMAYDQDPTPITAIESLKSAMK